MPQAPVDSLKFPLAVDTARGTIALERDYAAHVKQMVIQVLLTTPGERINMPQFGAGLRRAVFGPNSDTTASLVQTLIAQNLDQWLSGIIRVDGITVESENSRMNVNLSYTILRQGTTDVLNLEVEP